VAHTLARGAACGGQIEDPSCGGLHGSRPENVATGASTMSWSSAARFCWKRAAPGGEIGPAALARVRKAAAGPLYGAESEKEWCCAALGAAAARHESISRRNGGRLRR